MVDVSNDFVFGSSVKIPLNQKRVLVKGEEFLDYVTGGLMPRTDNSNVLSDILRGQSGVKQPSF